MKKKPENYVELNKRAYDLMVERVTKEWYNYQPRSHWRYFTGLLLGRRILDLGCGPGRDAKYFSENGYDVVGVDISEKMISKSKKVAPKAKFLVRDMRNLRFRKESFDGVWCMSSLTLLDENHVMPVLEKINSLLKKGGTLFLSMKEGEGAYSYGRGEMKRYGFLYSKKDIEQKIRQAGFDVVKKRKEAGKYCTWLNFFCIK
ncbi:MAG: hypothetical protein DRP29_08335 [Thermodesulfobacteriota bacterium]|nr:MAG: hypothetical protein DRP29_08335 [Thermodesulfobacteriota bacterium]